jgi:hypothetical protein
MNNSFLGALVFPGFEGGAYTIEAERFKLPIEFLIWDAGWKMKRSYCKTPFEWPAIKLGKS